MSLIALIRQGDIGGAINKVIAIIEGEIEVIEKQFPFLGDFVEQFNTDLGKAILTEVQKVAPSVIANPSTFLSAAQGIAEKVLADGIAAGEQDALEVAKNALRTAVSAPAKATGSGDVSPPPAGDPPKAAA